MTQEERVLIDGVFQKDDLPEAFERHTLLQEILDELSRRHLHDDREKLTAFLVACTAYAPDSRHHVSIAFLGDSSVGKDNLMDTVLAHFPDKHVLSLTRATESVLEDDIGEVRIIQFSEVNAGREGGANAHLTEVVKQLTEGGVSSMKKDSRTGFKTTRHSLQVQKTVFFSTTEERRDAELETRFLTVSIRRDRRKVAAVNNNTLQTWADPCKLKYLSERSLSWVKPGLEKLNYDLRVLIPYTPLLEELFDSEDPRSQRDVKRLLCLTAGHAWLYQRQRPKILAEGVAWVVAAPVDFLNVFKISGLFFNMTYKGLESRLQAVLDFIEEETVGDWGKSVRRLDIEKGLNVTKNTIKKRLGYLRDSHFIEIDDELTSNNDIWYRRCQTGCQKLLIGINYEEIKQKLETFNIEELTPYNNLKTTELTRYREAWKAEIELHDLPQAQGVKKKEVRGVKASPTNLTAYTEGIDTLSLTPSVIDKMGVCSACCKPGRWLCYRDHEGREYCDACKPSEASR